MAILSSLQFIVAIGGTILEGVCVISLFVTGHVRRLPFVISFLLYLFISDCFLISLQTSGYELPSFLYTTCAGYVFEAAALFNLWHEKVVIIGRARWLAMLISVLVALGCVCFSHFGSLTKAYDQVLYAQRNLLIIDQVVSIVRILLLLSLFTLRDLQKKRFTGLERLIVLALAVYAIFALLNHVVGGLCSSTQLQTEVFGVTNLISGVVWILLLTLISWRALDFPGGHKQAITRSVVNH